MIFFYRICNIFYNGVFVNEDKSKIRKKSILEISVLKVKIVIFRFVKCSSKDRKINKKLLFYIKNCFQKNSTKFNQNVI